MREKSEVRELLAALDTARKNKMRPGFLELGLTLGQGQPRILNCLLKEENLTQKEIADRCHADTTTLSRTLDNMEKAGLLLRLNCPESRRSWRVVLTDKGRETAERVREIFGFMDNNLCAGFSQEELETLCGLLSRIEENLSR